MSDQDLVNEVDRVMSMVTEMFTLAAKAKTDAETRRDQTRVTRQAELRSLVQPAQELVERARRGIAGRDRSRQVLQRDLPHTILAHEPLL